MIASNNGTVMVYPLRDGRLMAVTKLMLQELEGDNVSP